LDCTIQGFMKIGQDMYKTFIDMDKKVQLLTIFDKKLEKLGLKAPWTDWPNDYAFKHMIPSVIKREELEQEWVVKMSDKDANEAVWPAMAGTVPTICRWTLPSLKDVHEVQIDILPQGFFRRWVLKPSDELYQEARAFQDWYNARSERVNWTDPASVKKLRKDMLEPIETWLAKRSVVEASDALWWVAHSMSDDLSASASVFIAFPEECKRIVGTKPGKGAKHLYIVSGLHNQLPENPDELEFDGEIMTVSWPDKKLKVNVARKIIVASVPGQVPPSNTTLPNRTLAFFVVDRAQPDDGRYHIKLTRFSKASHSALLS
jgi:hypothetical protein